MANLEIKLSANKRQPYLRHRVVGRVGDGGLTTINVQLLEEDEITPFVINLNGTLKFVGEVSNGNYTEGEPEIIDSTNGLISYTFTKSNFSTSHQFKQAYFEYVDPNGKKVTFQNFIIDVLERVDINSEQAKYYISSLEKLQSEMQTTFNQFISDKQVQYDQIYSRYNELVRLINESNKQANDRIDQTNQQIGDLGKLKKMYSNSIDFGNYDYSGNPNLFLNPTFSDLSLDAKIKKPVQSFVTDNGESFTVDLTAVTGGQAFYINNLPTMLKSTSYTYSIEAKADIDLPNGVKVRPGYFDKNGGMQYPFTTIIPNMTTSYKRYSYTQTNLPLDYLNSNFHYLQFYFPADVPRTKITIKYNIKTEKGTEATPYQPNLLDDPYWLGKTPLGENIADSTVSFPIKSSAYSLYQADMEEEFIVGQTYTLTMKATKPSIQTFIVYNESSGDYRYGNLEPVEGLVDTWGLTFTPQKVGANYPKRLTIIQYPQSTAGACQIDWLKIEKGDTRTPNISQFKYFGEGLKDSNNPNDYSWDVTPEYTEKRLNDSVSLTEPETVLGLKNFIDGIQVDGKDVRTKYSLSWTKIAISGKATSNYFYVRRDGDIITFSGQLTIKPISSWSENIIGNLIEEFYVSVIPGLNTITWDAISEDGKTHALARITKDGKLAIMQTYGDVTTAKSYWITQSFPAAISFE